MDDQSACQQDQQAIADYLSSERFNSAGTRPKDVPYRRPPVVTYDPVSLNPGFPSLLVGLIGLTVLASFFAVMMPVGMELVENFMVRSSQSYPAMMMVVQTLFLPPMIAFAFAVVTPMFWYGHLWLRFLLATIAVLPACFGFYVAITILQGNETGEFWFGFAVVMTSTFLSVAVVAVPVQLWSRFSMSHAREDDKPIPPLGTRSIFELTGIAAVYCAVLMPLDLGEYLVGILMFGGIGFCSAIGIIAALIIYFRAGGNRRFAITLSTVFVFLSACVVNGFFAAQEFGWQVLSIEALMIGAVSIYGTIIIFAVMWLSLRWLRFCGWTCVNQRALARKS